MHANMHGSRVGRPLAFRRDSPPSRSGPKAPRGGGGGSRTQTEETAHPWHGYSSSSGSVKFALPSRCCATLFYFPPNLPPLPPRI